jgi:thymidylate synthase (FAD)
MGDAIEWSYERWVVAMQNAEEAYFDLLYDGWTPEQARTVLPNSLKTEVVMTANLREWRHFFRLRCAPAAHPQMRQIANLMLAEFKNAVPVIFDDLEV